MGHEAVEPIAEGRYRLVDVLGVGGMATVYRAYDERLRVYRAIKVLAPSLSSNQTLQLRFENEARTMALLHHPNIVTVHDVGNDGQRSYIVMELVEGGSLLDWLDHHGPMPPRMGAELICVMLQALDVAHRNGVIHRDVKPHNILVTRNGHPKLTDFGIAQATDSDRMNLTRTGSMMGTWGFMAPEQRDNARDVDSRADIYAAGATLYALVTNKMPIDLFAADMDDELLLGIPEPLQEVIRQATRYKSASRYASALEMLDALKASMDALPALPPETPKLGLQEELRDNRPPPNVAAPAPRPANAVNSKGDTSETFYVFEPQTGGAVTAIPSDTDFRTSEVASPVTGEGTIVPKEPRGGQEGERRGLALPALGVAALLLLGVGWWLTRGSAGPEALTAPPVEVGEQEPATAQPQGVQVPVAAPTEGGEAGAGGGAGAGDVGTVDSENGTASVDARGAEDERADGGSAGGGADVKVSAEESSAGSASSAGATNAGSASVTTVTSEGSAEKSSAGNTGATSAGSASGAETADAGGADERLRVAVSGDAREVWLVGSGGRLQLPQTPVPPGTYSIEAAFGEGAPKPAGQIVLTAGQSATINCKATFARCK